LFGCTSAGIKLLCDPGRNVDPSIQTAFDNVVRDAAAATRLISPRVPALKHLSSHAASGNYIYLTALKFVSVLKFIKKFLTMLLFLFYTKVRYCILPTSTTLLSSIRLACSVPLDPCALPWRTSTSAPNTRKRKVIWTSHSEMTKRKYLLKHWRQL